MQSVFGSHLEISHMPKHKIRNDLSWGRPKSRLPGRLPPGKKPETRTPTLWLVRDDDEVYLVNHSGEPLDSVVSSTHGLLTIDDCEGAFLNVDSPNIYSYENVASGCAIKVEEFDKFFDGDCLLQTVLKVKCRSLGCVNIVLPLEKGGVRETVILWDTGEVGKSVAMQDCPDAGNP